MEYSKIIAVSGLPGLHELINSKNDGAILRSLDDKSTRFVSGRVHNFSHLESIEIYTVRENVNLVDILQAMEKKGGALPDVKDNAAVKKYFEGAYPDLDFDRVYSSDMKKIIKWYEILKKNDIEIKLSEPAAEEEAPAEEAVEEAPKAKSKAKKEAAEDEGEKKKAPAKKKDTAKETEKEVKEKPAKSASKTAKPAGKSAKAEEKEAPKKKAAPKKK